MSKKQSNVIFPASSKENKNKVKKAKGKQAVPSTPTVLLGPKETIVEELDSNTESKIQLFDFIKIMFSNSEKFKKMNNYEKAKFSFMIQRFMSIGLPKLACAIDLVGINQAEVVNIWESNFARRMGGKQPTWMFTKFKKNNNTKTSFIPKKETEFEYKKIYEIDDITFNMLKEKFPDELEIELKELEELLDGNN